MANKKQKFPACTVTAHIYCLPNDIHPRAIGMSSCRCPSPHQTSIQSRIHTGMPQAAIIQSASKSKGELRRRTTHIRRVLCLDLGSGKSIEESCNKSSPLGPPASPQWKHFLCSSNSSTIAPPVAQFTQKKVAMSYSNPINRYTSATNSI